MAMSLVLLKKKGTRKSFAISKGITVIGRREDCDLCIPLRPVSRRHCELRQKDGILAVRDLSSSNGTFVNGVLIEEIQLNAGDFIQIGPLTFTLQIDGKPDDIAFPEDIFQHLEDTFFESLGSPDDTLKEN